MVSLYELMFDDIPLLVVPGTEDSEVIEYETSMQRNVRLMNEYKLRQLREQIEKLKLENAYLEITVLCRQKLLPESTEHDWSEE